jgi:L-arabinose isomerase
MNTCRIGLFGIGLDAYWPQYKGLKPRLEGYLRAVQKKLERPGVEVVNLGLIGNPVKALEIDPHISLLRESSLVSELI